MNFDVNRAQRAVFDLHQQVADSLSAGTYHDRFMETQLEDAAEALKELRELRRIADAAQKQAELAEKQAEAAKVEAANAQKEAKAAKHQGTIANVVAVISVIIAVVSWLVPQELIAAWLAEVLKQLQAHG